MLPAVSPLWELLLAEESYLTQGHGLFLVQTASEDYGDKKAQVLRLKAIPAGELPVGSAEELIDPESQDLTSPFAQSCFFHFSHHLSLFPGKSNMKRYYLIVCYVVAVLITLPYLVL